MAKLEAQIKQFDDLLKPIGNRVSTSEDVLREHPLTTAGIRTEAEALMRKIIDFYRVENSEWRDQVRGLFDRYEAFAWAADSGVDRTTQEGLGSDLVMFSIQDQGRDPRDAMLWLKALSEEAKTLNIDLSSLLTEVGALSSTSDRYGWGSTQSWLLAL